MGRVQGWAGCASAFCAIPPTAVGGSFRPSLQRTRTDCCESHPRQWVDRSSLAYRTARARTFALAVRHMRLEVNAPRRPAGCAWTIYPLPGWDLRADRGRSGRLCLNDPPTAVGGIDKLVHASLVGRA